MDAYEDLPVLGSLDEVAGQLGSGEHVYVRWSHGPAADLAAPSSSDQLTGTPLPGLSANPLDVEPWWGQRPTRIWVARRLHDYSHLPGIHGDGVRPWLLRGREVGRGPDNEPLLKDVEPLAWIEAGVLDEAAREIMKQPGAWGPIQRTPDP
ncbi:DUF6098 family protein [Streptomyces sp. NPDC003042]